MIKVDSRSLNRAMLEERVRSLCAAHGSVRDVVILQDDRWHGFALAGVEMSGPAESDAILRHYGDHQIRDIVVITIEQE